jgi:CBS domain
MRRKPECDEIVKSVSARRGIVIHKPGREVIVAIEQHTPGEALKRRWAAIPTRDVIAVGASLLFLALGFGAIYAVSKVAEVKDGVVLAALLIVPALLYLLLSGRVSDVKGPGGLEVRLSEVAREPIPLRGKDPGTSALSYERVRAVERGRTESFLEHIRDITPDDPVVLTLTLGSGPIDGKAAADYARGLTQFPRFRFVAIVDSGGALISYMQERAFRHLVESDVVDTRALLDNIEHKNVGAVRSYPGMIVSTVTRKTSIAQSLREMERLRTNALLVTQDGRIEGIVERDHVANALLLSLIDEARG